VGIRGLLGVDGPGDSVDGDNHRDWLHLGVSALRRLQIPSDYETTGPRREDEFKDVTKVGRLTLVVARLSPEVVADFETCLSSTARVIGSDLTGQEFGRFRIAAA
jgi:hypothetical protein